MPMLMVIPLPILIFMLVSVGRDEEAEEEEGEEGTEESEAGEEGADEGTELWGLEEEEMEERERGELAVRAGYSFLMMGAWEKLEARSKWE